MRFRGKPIRRKIVALLLVPLVSLVSIWAFATYLTGREAEELITSADVMDEVNEPVHDVTHAIQRERRQVLIHLADPRSSDALTQLQRQQRSTDQSVDTVRERADGGVREDLSPRARANLGTMLEGLKGLRELREKTGNNTLSRGGAFQAYNELIDPCYVFLESLHGVPQAGLEKQAGALLGISLAREYLAREDALMAAAFAAGEVTRGDRRAFSDRIAERNLSFGVSLQQLPVEDRESFENYWSGTDGRTLTSYEDTIMSGRRNAAAVGADRWDEATSAVLDDLQKLHYDAQKRYRDRIEPEADHVLLKAVAAGALGLLAVLASLVISLRVGRGLIRDLSTLRKEAHESAGVRLPSVMRRLAAGEQVDVETEAPRLDYPKDEAGQVGQALNTLQRAAVEAAVKQAGMRRGVSEVFVNLARRNQVLLHRQLTLLDTMERRTEDADELADLFRLDHLTTRMRRHAEGLVILSGAAPSRQWRKPVQLMDVVRAAVAEVEDYERIEVRRLAKLAVDGSAVADLTHLIAELLENATVFSPPHTAVQVLGERVANGFTLEIHDRGLGMTAEALLDANLRLAETPEFELSDTDRLGLFVVSRLAQRQGVRVSLQTSPYGGTTAVVLIPGSVLTESSDRDDARGTVSRADGDGGTDGRPAALAQVPAPRLESGGTPSAAALDGPVELEAPLGELDMEDVNRPGGLYRSRSQAPEPGPAPVSASEQHQQAREPAEVSRSAGADGTAPLPRRRPGAPVLVSDHGRTVEDRQRQPGPRRAAGEPRSEQPGPGQPGPERGTDGPATVGGLPRRVRQASIAPQLRADPDDDAYTNGDRDRRGAAPDERDAEEVRTRMASMQRGWQRGRQDNGAPSGDGAEDTAAGTPSEGEDR